MVDRSGGNNVGDFLITVYPSDPNFYFNSAMTSGWCIEGWCRVTQNVDGPPSANPFFTLGSTIGANPKAEWYDVGGTASSTFRFLKPDGTDVGTTIGGSEISPNWAHIAMQVPEGGGFFQWLVDGQVFSSTSWSDTSSTRTFIMGPTGTEVTAGYRFTWDEIRLSNIQRYTFSPGYTVPTSTFTSDSNTLGLFRLEQNLNDSTNQ